MKTRIIVVRAMIFLAIGLSTYAKGQGHPGHGKSGGHHAKHGGDYKNANGKRNLSDKIYRITEADSLQKIKMKPLVDKAAKRMESLRASYQKQETKTLDSLRAQLKPILKEEQLKKLEGYGNHSKK
jgi:hypothetical protein